MIDHYLLRVAQGELAIAKVIGDGNLWARAMQKMRVAMGAPRYKRGGCNGQAI
ncbi:host cell division inhibitory peptide Kil [Citrobacter freundii]|nr:host cell division inhibitory peptide Kil [Citrobacter freundii]